MNVNMNGVRSRAPDCMIRNNPSKGTDKVKFKNMLNKAIANNENLMALLGNNLGSPLNECSFEAENHSIGFEYNDERQNYYCYENIYGIADIFFFRPDAAIEEIAAGNNTINPDNNVIDARLQNGLDTIAGPAIKEKKESVSAFQSNAAENPVPGAEVQKGTVFAGYIERFVEEGSLKPEIEPDQKQKNEQTFEMSSPGTDPAENKIITISDDSNKIKPQVLAQVKDKIIIMTEESQDSNSIKTITMELKPKTLGKVDIKMSYENNKLTVEIKASNEETQKILSSNIDELRDLLGKTSETDVKIIVKTYEPKDQNALNYQGGGQDIEDFYQDNGQNYQGRQRNKYYWDNKIKSKEEDVFSELININYSKIKEGMHGN